MNAIQPSRPPLQPVEPRRVAPQKRQRRRRHPYRILAVENTAKLAVNIVFSVLAVSALVQLVPYLYVQQEKLQEIRSEVNQVDGRVNRLRTDFSRYFDPQQAKSIMQEQSERVDPKQRQVILVDKTKTQVQVSTQSH